MARARSRLRISDRLVVVTAGVIVVAVMFAAGSYMKDYRNQGGSVPISFESLSGSHEAQAIFERYNIVGEALEYYAQPGITTLDTYALAAEVNLRFIGRSYGSPPSRLGDRVGNPVALVVFQFQCPSYTCLSNIDPRSIVFVGSGLAVVELSPNSADLSQLPEQQWSTWVAQKFTGLGGWLPGLMSYGPPR